jgi:transcription initiation factor TFIIH subunit 4
MSVGTQSYQLSDYLEKLPGTTFRRLYQQPSTAFAIFRRMLPHLAKTFVMALLYMPGPMLLSELDVWVKPDSKLHRDRALSILRSLHIVQITPPSRDKPQEMTLTTNFKNSLRLALEGGGNHNSFGVPSTLPVDPAIDIPFLDRYARKKWDDILHFVVDSVAENKSAQTSSGPKASVKDLLLAGRLVERRSSKGPVAITQAGFTFLLQEANAQVWTLLLLWLEAASAPGSQLEVVDMLSFLFMLASLELGRAYDTDALTEPRRNMLPSLVDFGLIYIPRDTPRQYFPTRLATTLTSTASALLFTHLTMRFAGMVTGRLTRESIRGAIDHGITADQIIAYLAAHAHEQMARAAAAAGRPVLPPTVVDQIRLWQLENERMNVTRGYLFKDFESKEEYAALSGYADEVGVLVWQNDERRMFFASKVEQLRDFMKSRKKIEA